MERHLSSRRSRGFPPRQYLASEIHVSENLESTKAIPYTQAVTKDWTDNLLARWATINPGVDMATYQVTARISRIGQHIARHQEEVFGTFGLSRGEVGVLSALRVAGPPHRLSPTRLFKGLMLSSAGITSRLDRLESRGLVKRTRDPNDRRAILVELTGAGRKLLDEAVGANTKSERALLDDFSTKEIATISRMLRKMLMTLEPEAAS
jgi:DNA-binding MarR family transcriptional regulator